MAYASHIRTANPGVFGRIAEFRRNLAERAAQFATYRRTIHELSQLSDRELADLGMHRVLINEVAHSAAYGK